MITRTSVINSRFFDLLEKGLTRDPYLTQTRSMGGCCGSTRDRIIKKKISRLTLNRAAWGGGEDLPSWEGMAEPSSSLA